jgi:hypothetical protein
MAIKIDPKETVSFEGLLMGKAIEQEALVNGLSTSTPMGHAPKSLSMN